ncbi:flagellar hook-basal body complex protein FliE [Dyella kyungheensis]|uniref:Flagellar hook-basal body complex protein FliE n=1 Tax=Dyella kyungheensis TaxID=1242174 RepID=A0ABS2JPH2_9GAMM|nr:flagellar hook-basal body complex protein FliE [Dyella kyungheensis]MBM7120921.1 flagellar hook-basal body complex protein FliE [Dyella kyungheensis]
MSVSPIDAISLGRMDGPEHAAALNLDQGPSFMQMVGSEVQGLNASLNTADASARSLAAGDGVPVHDVMIAMEQAHLKLQFAVEVRNRMIDAYQSLTNMQL